MNACDRCQARSPQDPSERDRINLVDIGEYCPPVKPKRKRRSQRRVYRCRDCGCLWMGEHSWANGKGFLYHVPEDEYWLYAC